MSAAWVNLPAEMRARTQWLLAGPNDKGELKVPLTVNAAGERLAGSSTASATWLTFERAAWAADELGLGLGYVLSADDPFCCVDLDVKNEVNAPDDPSVWTDDERKEIFNRIYETLDSYSELSQSGQGLHIWCKGKIGKGVKRDGVEIYSQERFIACTGKVVRNVPIQDRSMMLLNMAGQMREQEARADALYEVDPVDTDDVVFARAAGAINGDKFRQLCDGRWQETGEYPSQSEADLALMSMFTFYSKSNTQCRRMFRMTALGQREKAQKNDRYLNYTLGLIRGRIEREERAMAKIEISVQATKERQRALAAEAAKELEHKAFSEAVAGIPLNFVALPMSVSDLVNQVYTTAQPEMTAPVAANGDGMRYPPGVAGHLAEFIFQSAPRPVREVAIVAALGWLAGVCGKAWCIPQSGLNLYIILVARSAVGKEAMHSGISILTRALVNHGYVHATGFVDFTEYASGPALQKAVAVNPSFVNISGEWGRRLKRLAEDRMVEGPMATLRTTMTNLYNKSGPTSIVGGLGYSSTDNNVASINGVNYSMIGETTPETFYNSLTDSMMEDGFLSRFAIIEYKGDRPKLNQAQAISPPQALIEVLGGLTALAKQRIDAQPTLVQRTAEAAKIMGDFDLECDAKIDSYRDDDSHRQMWNRAHLKAVRIAALLAVADQPLFPEINVDHITWAIELIRGDIKIMNNRIEDGDVGTGDASRERKIMALCKDYLGKALPAGYQIPDAMHAAGIVPRKYLQIRTQRVGAFSQHRAGATRSLDEALRSLCDSGYLQEVDKVKAADTFGYSGKCYKIVHMPN